MWIFGFIAAVLALANAFIATGAWMFLSKHATRPKFARASGALVGGVAGAWVAAPELDYVTELVCDLYLLGNYPCDAAFPAWMFYVYPFSLPVTSGLCAWLLAEIIGGRGPKPLFNLGLAILGAVLAAALVLLPPFFIPSVERVLLGPMAVGVPALGALLALTLAQRHLAPSGQRKHD